MASKKVSGLFNSLTRVVVMLCNILSGNIRNVFLITKPIPCQYQADFSPLPGSSKVTGTDK